MTTTRAARRTLCITAVVAALSWGVPLAAAGAAGDTADLRLTKQCSPYEAPQGTPVTCTIVAQNPGPDAAREVVVQDVYSSTAGIGAVTIGQPRFVIDGDGRRASFPCDPPSQRRFTCALGTVPVGGRGVITVTFRTSAGTTVDDTATVTTASTDPNPGNDQATARFVAQPAPLTQLVTYQATGWRFREVGHGALSGFEGGAEPFGFATGQGGFGSGGDCPVQDTAHTHWDVDTDLLLRRSIQVPAGASNLRLIVTVDNDFRAFWNGTEIGAKTHNGCAVQGGAVLDVPSALVKPGAGNLLAIRAVDRGDEAFVDARVTANVLAPVRQLVAYQAPGWRFQQVAHGELPDFQFGNEPSGFASGRAGFGSGGGCAVQRTVHTHWGLQTDLLLRRAITVPPRTTGIRLAITIDDDVEAYWNGTLIAAATHDGCATTDGVVVEVSSSLFRSGATDVLAIRATDHGGEAFVDARVTAVVP